jgi:hypothetical protein
MCQYIDVSKTLLPIENKMYIQMMQSLHPTQVYHTYGKNKDRPFKVYITEKEGTFVYKKPTDTHYFLEPEEHHPEYYVSLAGHFYPQHIFVGKSPKNKMTLFHDNSYGEA